MVAPSPRLRVFFGRKRPSASPVITPALLQAFRASMVLSGISARSAKSTGSCTGARAMASGWALCTAYVSSTASQRRISSLGRYFSLPDIMPSWTAQFRYPLYHMGWPLLSSASGQRCRSLYASNSDLSFTELASRIRNSERVRFFMPL